MRPTILIITNSGKIHSTSSVYSLPYSVDNIRFYTLLFDISDEHLNMLKSTIQKFISLNLNDNSFMKIFPFLNKPQSAIIRDYDVVAIDKGA